MSHTLTITKNIPFDSAEVDNIIDKCIADATAQVEAEKK